MVRISEEYDRYLQNLCPYVICSTDKFAQVAWLDMDRDILAGQRELLLIYGVWIQINLN